MAPYPLRKPLSLVYSFLPATKSLTFFLIIVKMNLENKVISFQFEPEKSIFDHKGFYQDSCLSRKIWYKCRNCSTMKTEKKCLCHKEVEDVRDFNLQGIFVLSQAIILSKLTKNLMVSISISLCNQKWFQYPCHA